MSSHGGSVPSQASPILVGILFALVTPLIGQGTPGHFYHVNYYQVQQGQEKAYDSALAHVVSPVFDEMVKRKAAVSYLLLKKVAGSGDYTHLVIVEVAKPSAAEGIFQRAAALRPRRAVHDRGPRALRYAARRQSRVWSSSRVPMHRARAHRRAIVSRSPAGPEGSGR